MTQGIAQELSIREIAAEVQRLTTDTVIAAKFRGRVSKYLHMVQQYHKALQEWTDARDNKVRAAQQDRRLTDRMAGAPQSNWEWHSAAESLTSSDESRDSEPAAPTSFRMVGAWIDPDHGSKPVDPHFERMQVYDYALLTAVHDLYCVGSVPLTGAPPLLEEAMIAPDAPADSRLFQQLKWCQFKERIERETDLARLAARLGGAMERVRKELAPPPIARAVSIPAAADRVDDAAAELQRFIDTIPMVFSRRVGDYLCTPAGVSLHKMMDPWKAVRIVMEAAGKVDGALKALGVLHYSGTALDPKFVGEWREWLYCIAPKECSREAHDVLDFGKGLCSWDDERVNDLSEVHEVRVPANTAEWAASAARIAKSIASRLRAIPPSGISGCTAPPAPTAHSVATPPVPHPAGAESWTPDHPTVPRPPLRRPIPISEAAGITGKRSDIILNRLRRAEKPVGGTRRNYVAELNDIIELYPKAQAKLRKWADREYPERDE